MENPMTFKHRPKMGDVIYSLPFIKEQGGGVLYLDPDSPHFVGEKDSWIRQFNWLIPLLATQPYIHEVKIWEGEIFDVDLDKYMNTTHLRAHDKVNIVDNHFIGQGKTPVPYKKWLSVSSLPVSNIVVANSGNHHNSDADYNKLLSGIGDFIFVGTEAEDLAFFNRSGVVFRNRVASDALHLAQIIDGAEIFIGNQSLPLAIALGLGKKCYVEQSELFPNCIMGNYIRL